MQTIMMLLIDRGFDLICGRKALRNPVLTFVNQEAEQSNEDEEEREMASRTSRDTPKGVAVNPLNSALHGPPTAAVR